MEDQQPVAGDLTDDDAPAADAAHHKHRMPVGKARRGMATAAADVAAADAAPEPEAEPEPEPAAPAQPEVPVVDETPRSSVVFVDRKPAGRRAPIAVGVAAAAFVAAGAFAGAALQPYLVEQAQVETKLDVARTAASAITTLWTYTPENMESLGDRASAYLGGDFEAQYRKYIDAIAPTNKQAQVTNNTQVVGAAVESLNDSEATAVVYTNTTSTSPLSKNVPAMRYLSYRLTLRHDDAKWLVTKMSTITSLDLTPQL